MADHAKYSPSGLEALALCPGKLAWEENYPESRSVASIDGTHSHTLREYCISHSKNAYPDCVGLKLSDHEGEFEVDEERAKRVQVSLNYVWDWIRESRSPQGFPILVEHRVNPGLWINSNDWWGTSDLVIDCPEFLLIDDYKDGSFPVYPEENPQALSYALGYLAEIHQRHPIAGPMMDKEVRLSISQPKHQPEPKIWKTTVGEVFNRLDKLREIILAAEQLGAPRVPGDKQCQFCRGKRDCPERLAAAQNAVEQAFGGIAVSGSVQGELARGGQLFSLTPASEMTGEEIARAIDAKDIVSGWFKEVEAEGIRRIQAGQTIPDHKLVRAAGRRKWIEDEEKIQKALRNMGLKKTEYTETRVISFAKVLGLPQLSDRQRKRVESELLVKPQGSLMLVPDTDKRPSAIPSAEQGFKDVQIPSTPTIPEPTQSEPVQEPFSFI